MNANNAFEGIHLPRSLMQDITNSLRDAIIEGETTTGTTNYRERTSEDIRRKPRALSGRPF